MTNLSLGERPVWGEVMAQKAPRSVSCPSPRGDGVLDQRGGGEVGVDADGKEAVLDQRETLTRSCGGLASYTPVRPAAR